MFLKDYEFTKTKGLTHHQFQEFLKSIDTADGGIV